MPRIMHSYGWKPDLPDQRDQLFQITSRRFGALPPAVDMRPALPPVFDQGNLGSCTANATGLQCWFLDTTVPVEPSRLFIYYNTRILEGTVREDSGASIRNSIKSVVRWGMCPEAIWPYKINSFTKKPSQAAYISARSQHILAYGRVVQSGEQFRRCLAEGYPINFGFAVYESFESNDVAATGLMPMPKEDERVLGGHAVLMVGYNDEHKYYIIRNSWGKNWGDDGCFYMPYDFAHSNAYCDDFWAVRLVE